MLFENNIQKYNNLIKTELIFHFLLNSLCFFNNNCSDNLLYSLNLAKKIEFRMQYDTLTDIYSYQF